MVGSDVFPIELVLFLGDMLVFRGVTSLNPGALHYSHGNLGAKYLHLGRKIQLQFDHPVPQLQSRSFGETSWFQKRRRTRSYRYIIDKILNYIVTSKADVTKTSMKQQQQQYLQVSRHILVVGIFAWIRYQFWLAHPTSWVMGLVITSKSFRIHRIYMNLIHLAWLRIPFLQCIISSAWDSEMFDIEKTKASEQRGQGMLDVLQSKSLPTPVPSAAEPSKADSKPMSSERLREFSFFGQANSNCLSTFQINSIFVTPFINHLVIFYEAYLNIIFQFNIWRMEEGFGRGMIGSNLNGNESWKPGPLWN